jgi:transcriptional repressor of cell division inhibition gene dicB
MFDIRHENKYDVNCCKQLTGLTMTTKEAIEHYGSIKKLADALGMWPHVIYRWGEYPPKARQYELEVKTNRKLKAEKDD